MGMKNCPFCGAHPHHGQMKVEYCQLHGEPFQRFRVWCPHGCAEKIGANRDLAIAAWNTRAGDVEILEAIKALRDECMGYVPNCAAQVDAAISKAEGRS